MMDAEIDKDVKFIIDQILATHRVIPEAVKGENLLDRVTLLVEMYKQIEADLAWAAADYEKGYSNGFDDGFEQARALY